jgi:protocatechuate 3,4-dioxygenase beta subunit
MVTQMYFPGDPLFEFDPIFNSVPDENARMRMVSSFDLEDTQPSLSRQARSRPLSTSRKGWKSMWSACGSISMPAMG